MRAAAAYDPQSPLLPSSAVAALLLWAESSQCEILLLCVSLVASHCHTGILDSRQTCISARTLTDTETDNSRAWWPGGLLQVDGAHLHCPRNPTST